MSDFQAVRRVTETCDGLKSLLASEIPVFFSSFEHAFLKGNMFHSATCAALLHQHVIYVRSHPCVQTDDFSSHFRLALRLPVGRLLGDERAGANRCD